MRARDVISLYITERKGYALQVRGARRNDIETALSKYFFVRCHVGYLLNCRFVEYPCRTSVTSTDGTVLPVSRAKAEETQTAFMAYMRSLRP